jgi:hypothetical protein
MSGQSTGLAFSKGAAEKLISFLLQCMSPRACRHHHWQDGQQARCGYHFVEASSDVHRMMWTDLVGDAIRLAQRKTGAKLAFQFTHPLAACLRSQTVTMRPFLQRLTANPSRSRGSATWCQRRSATRDYLAAVNHMAFGRPQREGSQRQVVRRVRSWRSPDTRRWPKLNATPARRNRST